MSLKKTCNNCKAENVTNNKHSFEWSLIKSLIRCNKRQSIIIYALLLLWFVTIIFLTL